MIPHSAAFVYNIFGQFKLIFALYFMLPHEAWKKRQKNGVFYVYIDFAV